MNAPTQAPRPLGALLVERGILSPDQMRIAQLEQEKSKQPFAKLLIELGFVSEATLRDALSESRGQESVDLAHAVADPAALALVPQAMAVRYRLLPLAFDPTAQRLTVAAADLDDLVALDRLRAQLPPTVGVDLRLAGEAEIARAIDRSYGHELSIDGILLEIESGEGAAPLAAGGDTYAQPVVRLIDALLGDAVKRDASDLHFEPEAGYLRIRYRIDGMLRQIRALHKAYWPAMAVRLKVMSGMNIAETRAAQDGACQLM
ncbi:MAG TPA: ATPase, T2SS/T4P/T4SS family, partial [Azospira sp.]|nr:ATPase, T2SS/T4P/T4SS family [Azospira sp.]